MTSGVINPDRVLAGRSFRRIARSTEFLETISSTNDHVWTRSASDDADGYTVFAEHQTSGRGRLGRSWQSPRGASVLCSVLLVDSPEHSVPEGGALCIIAGIAAAHAIQDATGLNALIDWPNDIVVGEKKVAGILVESRLTDHSRRAYAVGIGINCLQHRHHFPTELQDRATSLELETEQPVDRDGVAGALLSRLDEWLADPDRWTPQIVCEAFRQCSLPAGRRITLRYDGEIYRGVVVDIDPAAALVVMLDDGTRSVFPAAGTTVLRDTP